MERVKLYDIHGNSAVENFDTLLTEDEKFFYWDSKRFLKYNRNDVVFWVNRKKGIGLFTRIDEIDIKPLFEKNRNIIYDIGYSIFANAQSETQFEKFYRFKIIEKVNIPKEWNYSKLSPFNGQTMAIILYEEKIKDHEKKLEKVNDLKKLFPQNSEANNILVQVSKALNNMLKNSFDKTKEEFLIFMSKFHKNVSTSKDYVKMMPKIEKWFKSNNIASENYNIWRDKKDIKDIQEKLNGDVGELWKLKNKEEHNWYGSPWNMWVRFNEIEETTQTPKKTELAIEKFNLEGFISYTNLSGLFYNTLLLSRFIASLLTKPFLILTGLSGSGKTKLAQAFVQWLCHNESQYCMVPVGADWTNREPLLGYPNALNHNEYVKPDNGVLDLIIKANDHSDLPHFLILDEMNLSHVERYFADFLSAMESNETIPLHNNNQIENDVPKGLTLPPNLFIIGTVNIDETTNMFSPKVLDRANTVEFKVSQKEMQDYLEKATVIDMGALIGKGASMGKSFLDLGANKSIEIPEIQTVNETLVKFFGELNKIGAEFGYRSASEILRLINQLTVLSNDLTTNQKIDIAVVQKLLPKLHGSRRKLCPILEAMGTLCISESLNFETEVLSEADFEFNQEDVFYPLSLEKIVRMYRGAIDNGFASFAEA